MENLLRYNGTCKGIIAECMFKLMKRYALLTKIMNKYSYVRKYRFFFTDRQKDFLLTHWDSLDAIEINMAHKQLILYEIKAMNAYRTTLAYAQKLSPNARWVYSKAERLGFHIKVATVYFHENWDLEVLLEAYDESDFSIDRPNQIDLKVRKKRLMV
jgi:hypothetical protein